MSLPFLVTGGSVLGKEHRRVGRNNQDAFAFEATDDYLVAVVADGCSASPHSEVGAQLGVRFFLNAVRAARLNSFSDFWRYVLRNVVDELSALTVGLSEFPSDTDPRLPIINDYFLFTLVAAVIDHRYARFAAFGDGVIGVNDEVLQLGPFPGNAPPYVGRRLWADNLKDHSFLPVRTISTSDLRSFFVGTDGVADLIAASGQRLPGRDDLVGLFTEWSGDDLFANPFALQRRLTLMNREVVSVDPFTNELVREHGHLPDDTTLVVGRRDGGPP